MCTRFLHACSTLCKCANWLCRTCTPPPYRSRQIICLRSPSPPIADAALPSPATCRAGPSRARHSSTHYRTLCAAHGLCTSDLRVSEAKSRPSRMGLYVTSLLAVLSRITTLLSACFFLIFSCLTFRPLRWSQ
jgi:hypothetical protein